MDLYAFADTSLTLLSTGEGSWPPGGARGL